MSSVQVGAYKQVFDRAERPKQASMLQDTAECIHTGAAVAMTAHDLRTVPVCMRLDRCMRLRSKIRAAACCDMLIVLQLRPLPAAPPDDMVRMHAPLAEEVTPW